MNGIARGGKSAKNKPMIFGRKNINYEGPQAAYDGFSNEMTSTEGVKKDFSEQDVFDEGYDSLYFSGVKHKYDLVPLKMMDTDGLKNNLYSLSRDAEWSQKERGKFEHAVDFALMAHDGQTRMSQDGRMPYIDHPYRNTVRLHRWGCDNNTVLTATLLHDVIEDCADNIPESYFHEHPHLNGSDIEGVIEKQFGSDVLSVVDSVTLPPKPHNVKKIEHYVESVDNKVNSPEALLVKFSDFYDNGAGLFHNYYAGKNDDKMWNMSSKYIALLPVLERKIDDFYDDFPMHDPDVLVEAHEKASRNLLALQSAIKTHGYRKMK